MCPKKHRGFESLSYRQFMKKKLQKEGVFKTYITFMDYFATGEGRTIEINFCYAFTPKAAIDKHLAYFYGNDHQSAANYFGIDVEAAELESKRAKEVLRSIFKKSDSIIKTLKMGGQEFRYKFRFNLS